MSYSFNCKAFKLNPNIKSITLSNQIEFPIQKNLNLKCLDQEYADTIDSEYYIPGTFVEGERVDHFKDSGRKHGISTIFQLAELVRDPFDRQNLIFGDVPYINDYFGFQEENLNLTNSKDEENKNESQNQNSSKTVDNQNKK